MIAAFLSAQFNNIMKWLGFVGIALGVLLYVRKSGRDSERTAILKEQSYHDKQTIKQDAIIRGGASDTKRMSRKLSDALRRKRSS